MSKAVNMSASIAKVKKEIHDEPEQKTSEPPSKEDQSYRMSKLHSMFDVKNQGVSAMSQKIKASGEKLAMKKIAEVNLNPTKKQQQAQVELLSKRQTRQAAADQKRSQSPVKGGAVQ